MPVNCITENGYNGIFYVIYILPQQNIFKKKTQKLLWTDSHWPNLGIKIIMATDYTTQNKVLFVF